MWERFSATFLQAALDDELAIEGLGALPRLRKVALHGTRVVVSATD